MLSLVGCAGVQDMTGVASHDDVVDLRGQVAALQQAIHRARAEAESRTQQHAADGQRRTAELAAKVDETRAAIAALTARIDELTTRVE
ncbi:MAG TPA: hypothetical protein VNN07_18625, partial [Candidatus Tectomicrobia bacterium]|nr:hypothetical protein [Candidatus Tectomicrobia bacterium]